MDPWESPVGNKQWDSNDAFNNASSLNRNTATSAWDTPAVEPERARNVRATSTSNSDSANWESSTVTKTNDANWAAMSKGMEESMNQSNTNGNPNASDTNVNLLSWGNPITTKPNNDWRTMPSQMESLNLDQPSKIGVERSRSPRPARSPPAMIATVPEPTAFLDEVWPAFQEADSARDLDDVKAALAKLCEVYLGGSWQDMENKLRDEKCNTYLVAMEDTVSFGYTFVNLRSEPNQRYRVIPSFIKPGTAKKGRMSIGVASCYEENFERLENAGVVRSSGIPTCHNCKQLGHIAVECPEEKREPETSEYFGKCYNCGATDHRSRTCNEPRRVLICRNCNKEGHYARDCAEPPAPIVCNRCNEEGHISRDCDQPRTDIICNRCNEPGHIARDCDQPGMDIICIVCNQPGHKARDCVSELNTCNRCQQLGHATRYCDQPRIDMTCNRCNQPGHKARDCDQPPRVERGCFNCGEYGHTARDCPQPRTGKCYNCNRSGHKSNECPNESNEKGYERRPPRDNRFGFGQGF